MELYKQDTDNLNDIINNIQQQIDEFDNMVDHLWNNIMITYIENGNLLQKLSYQDKIIFYNYMLNNCESINKLHNLLDYYTDLKQKMH